ncbi:hypothetical protein CCC13826_1710 [Campylobacter concisus 13826]|uniref:Uncharacterized protein n=1 Tax=Campylobacter concisus (strain 13826) TaxID=360104 RepID=A7ZFV1_CAMC1|nr:hypothetical protein CCC13826_1710 [Campylobacter concisus 13826]
MRSCLRTACALSSDKRQANFKIYKSSNFLFLKSQNLNFTPRLTMHIQHKL